MFASLLLLLLGALLCNRRLLQLLRQPLLQQLAGASMCCLLVVWQIRAELPEYPAIHFLMLTTLVVLLGLQLGLCTLLCAWLFQAAYNDWYTGIFILDRWAMAGCLLVGAACFSYSFYLVVDRWLPKHFANSLFVGVFINAGMTACGYYSCLLLWQTPEQQDIDWLVLSLIALPEALLNGMAMTLLMVYRPEWIAVLRQSIFRQ